MKVTIITGASGGIGEALAHKLAARKHNLFLIARSVDKLDTLCRKLVAEFGINAQYFAADLSKPASAQEIFDEVKKRGLEVNLLVNNAGIGSGGEFAELSLSSELDLLQLNNHSLVALCHYCIRDMKERGGGTIVNVASMAAFMPVPYMAVYAGSKAFVRSFTEAITQECLPYGIDVLLFCPGLTKTNFNAAAGIENEKGKGLSSDYNSASTQTAEEVADEMIKAMDKKQHKAVSGTLNRLGANMMALLPNAMIAKSIAKSYRKKINS